MHIPLAAKLPSVSSVCGTSFFSGHQQQEQQEEKAREKTRYPDEHTRHLARNFQEGYDQRGQGVIHQPCFDDCRVAHGVFVREPIDDSPGSSGPAEEPQVDGVFGDRYPQESE